MFDPPRLPAFDLDLDPHTVERALRKLPHRSREALLLKTREGLSYAEIGALLGITPADAEAHIASALLALRVRLARSERPWWRFWG